MSELRGTYKQRRAQAISNARKRGPVDWEAMQKRIKRMSRAGRIEYLEKCRNRHSKG